MSDFLAEARVLVRPDTTRFRAELQTEVARAVAGIKVPPVRVPIATGAGRTRAGDIAAINSAADAERRRALQMLTGANVTKEATKAAADHARQLGQVQKAGFAAGAGLLGLRGAVLTAGTAFLAATVGIQAFIKTVQGFAEFEAQLKTFAAVAGATSEQLAAVGEESRKLGADITLPAVSATDAATAMTELAKAGLSVEESMAGARGVLELATAAQISNAEAAQIAANALNSFQLEGDQAGRVADVLANAANAAQGSITDIGIAFKQASAVARQVGLSLENTTSILALLARNGLQGSDAGTSLRVALIRLVAPTKKAREEIEKLGLEIRDIQGNLRADVFAQFGQATRDLSPAARDAAAALIFGQDAIRAVSIAAREGTDGLRLMQFEIDQQGTAAEVAASRTSGLAGAFEALSSNASTLGTALGGIASGPIGQFIRGLADLARLSAAGVEGLGDLNQAAEENVSGWERSNEIVGEFLKQGLVPIPVQAFKVAQGLGLISDASEEMTKALEEANEELQALQDARIAAERAGRPGLANQLTKQIEAQRKAIQNLKSEAETGIRIRPEFQELFQDLTKAKEQLEEVLELQRSDPGADPFHLHARETEQDLADINRELERLKQIATVSDGPLRTTSDNLAEIDRAARGAGFTMGDLATQVDTAARALRGLQIEASRGADELLKLQSEGGTPQQEIAARRGIIATQQDIIAEARARGIQVGDPTTIRKARAEIIRQQSAIDALNQEIASKREASANAAEQAEKERVQSFLARQAAAREDQRNVIASAGLTAMVTDDIREQEEFLALVVRQIAAIRKSTLTEKEKAAAIRELTSAKISTQAALRELRAQEEEERANRRDQVQQLNIDIAVERGNEAAIRKAINARINTLNKQIAAARGDQVRVKQLILEKERLRNQLDELNEVEEENKETARERAAAFFFSQLQAQQGFAANLMGNLIRGPTAGLVGVPAPGTPGNNLIGSRTSAEAAAAAGRAAAVPTAGQANTEISILNRILSELRKLNGSYDAPEAIHNKKVTAAWGDTFGM